MGLDALPPPMEIDPMNAVIRMPYAPPTENRIKEHQKLIQNEGFKTKLLKYEPEGDKSTTGSFMVPFFSSNSEKNGFRLLSKTLQTSPPPPGGRRDAGGWRGLTHEPKNRSKFEAASYNIVWNNKHILNSKQIFFRKHLSLQIHTKSARARSARALFVCLSPLR